MSDNSPRTSGFCIYIDTFCQGPVPTVFDENDKPCIYPTEVEAQREIVDHAMTRLGQFLDGERDFDDAITVEEYVVAVDVHPDGSVVDAEGNRFCTVAHEDQATRSLS
jgi:hypothetical protein